MPKIIINDVPGLDGEYDLDMTFTHRDFHTIKQVAGIRANEVQGALEAGDMDIIVAMAEIALRRAGKVHLVDQLWDAEAGSITLDVEDLEEDASPPPQEPEPRSDDERSSSGISTNGDTDASPETSIPDSSGIPRLGSTSGQLTSTT
jgi:hypothetical protein